MRTFLASFCVPGAPLAKALGILPEKPDPSLGANDPPWNFKSKLCKHLQLGDANISGGFSRCCAEKL
jgi:hypothetical protein